MPSSLGPTGISEGPWRAMDERKLAKDEEAVAAVGIPCREMIELAEVILHCERPRGHEDIHECRIDVHSYLRWSYAGRRILPLDPEHEAREREASLRRRQEYHAQRRDRLLQRIFLWDRRGSDRSD